MVPVVRQARLLGVEMVDLLGEMQPQRSRALHEPQDLIGLQRRQDAIPVPRKLLRILVVAQVTGLVAHGPGASAAAA